MSDIDMGCCGNCVWYNGNMQDKEAFCDNREEYVARHNWCPKYREDEYKIELKEDMKVQNF